jgi:dTDP-4-amino-4,6-dideoxygalactose transaminase
MAPKRHPSTIFRTYGASREDVRLALGEEDIEARPVWKPMHLQPVFDRSGQWSVVSGQKGKDGDQRSGVGGQKTKQRYAARKVGGEVAEDLFERGLCLPSGTAMTDSDLDRVIETILKCKR